MSAAEAIRTAIATLESERIAAERAAGQRLPYYHRVRELLENALAAIERGL